MQATVIGDDTVRLRNALPSVATIMSKSATKARRKYTHVGCGFESCVFAFFLFVARTPEPRRILGDAIRNCRSQAELSQEKLAEKADLHPVYIGKVERGEQWISLHALLRVAKALGVRLRDLVSEL